MSKEFKIQIIREIKKMKKDIKDMKSDIEYIAKIILEDKNGNKKQQ